MQPEPNALDFFCLQCSAILLRFLHWTESFFLMSRWRDFEPIIIFITRSNYNAFIFVKFDMVTRNDRAFLQKKSTKLHVACFTIFGAQINSDNHETCSRVSAKKPSVLSTPTFLIILKIIFIII